MTTAKEKDLALQQAAQQHSVNISLADARILRRAELTLNRWDTRRCGWSTSGPYGASYVLVRDEDGDNKPYLEIHPNVGLKTRRERVSDLERGAIKRIEAVCKKYPAPNGSPLKYYHQKDPRGASLYIEAPHYNIDPSNYTGAVSCAVR